MSFQEAISDSRMELTMEEYEKLNMSAFNRPTGGITLNDLQETMLEGTAANFGLLMLILVALVVTVMTYLE